MSSVPVEDARAGCANFVARSCNCSQDELANDLGSIGSWLSAVVPHRFFELSQFEQAQFSLSPAASVLASRVIALAQVEGLSAALTAALRNSNSRIVYMAAELIAAMMETVNYMPSSTRNVSLLPQNLLVSVPMVEVLVGLLKSTDSESIFCIVCKALTETVRHSAMGYEAALARDIVAILITRVKQLQGTTSPQIRHGLLLLATLVSMSQHEQSSSSKSASILPPYSDIDQQQSVPELVRLNRSFNDRPKKYVTAMPFIAPYINDIEYYFKQCILVDGSNEHAEFIVNAGLLGLAGLIRNEAPVSMLCDSEVVSRIRHCLLFGSSETVELIVTINKYGSITAKESIKDASIGLVGQTVSSSDLKLAVNRLDAISRLYPLESNLRNDMLKSQLPAQLIQLLNDGSTELVLRKSAIKVLTSIAHSTLSALPADALTHILSSLVDVVRRFEHIELVTLAVDGLCALKFTSAELHQLCTQYAVHSVLLDVFNKLISLTDNNNSTLGHILTILSTLVDCDDVAAVAVAEHPNLVGTLSRLSACITQPSLAVAALRLWHQLLLKELTVLSLADKNSFFINAGQLALISSVTASETGTALEALMYVHDDLNVTDRHRILQLCRHLLHGNCHTALLRPVGILMDAVMHTLAITDHERVQTVNEVEACFGVFAKPALQLRAIALMNSEIDDTLTTLVPCDSPPVFATPKILEYLGSLISYHSSLNVDCTAVRNALQIVLHHHRNGSNDIVKLFYNNQVSTVLEQICTNNEDSHETRFSILRGYQRMFKRTTGSARSPPISTLSVQRVLVNLMSSLDQLNSLMASSISDLMQRSASIFTAQNRQRLITRFTLLHAWVTSRESSDVPLNSLHLNLIQCAGSVMNLCGVDNTLDVPLILNCLTSIVHRIVESNGTHPFRAVLPMCVEQFHSVLEKMPPDSNFLHAMDSAKDIFTLILQDGLADSVRVLAAKCLSVLLSEYGPANIGKFMFKLHAELKHHLASSSENLYYRVLFTLMYSDNGKATALHKWLSTPAIYERFVQHLDKCIEDESFCSVLAQYSVVINQQIVRLLPCGLPQVLTRAIGYPNLTVCESALDILLGITKGGNMVEVVLLLRHMDSGLFDAVCKLICEPAMPPSLKLKGLQMLTECDGRAASAPVLSAAAPQIQAYRDWLVDRIPMILTAVGQIPSVYLKPPFVCFINALYSHSSRHRSMDRSVSILMNQGIDFIKKDAFGFTPDKLSSSIREEDLRAVPYVSQLCGLRAFHKMFILERFQVSRNGVTLLTTNFTAHLLGIAKNSECPSVLRILSMLTVVSLTSTRYLWLLEYYRELPSHGAPLDQLAELVVQLACDGGLSTHDDKHIQQSHWLQMATRKLASRMIPHRLVYGQNDQVDRTSTDTLTNYTSWLVESARWLQQYPENEEYMNILVKVLEWIRPQSLRILLRPYIYNSRPYKQSLSRYRLLCDSLSIAFSAAFNYLDQYTHYTLSSRVSSVFNTLVLHNPGRRYLRRHITGDECVAIGLFRQVFPNFYRLIQRDSDCSSMGTYTDNVVQLAIATESAATFTELFVVTGILETLFDGLRANFQTYRWYTAFGNLCRLMMFPNFTVHEKLWHHSLKIFVEYVVKSLRRALDNFKREALAKSKPRSGISGSGNNRAAVRHQPQQQQLQFRGGWASTAQHFNPSMPLPQILNWLDLDSRHPRGDLVLMKRVLQLDVNGHIRSILEGCLVHSSERLGELKTLRIFLDTHYDGCRVDESLADLLPVAPDSNPY